MINFLYCNFHKLKKATHSRRRPQDKIFPSSFTPKPLPRTQFRFLVRTRMYNLRNLTQCLKNLGLQPWKKLKNKLKIKIVFQLPSSSFFRQRRMRNFSSLRILLKRKQGMTLCEFSEFSVIYFSFLFSQELIITRVNWKLRFVFELFCRRKKFPRK